MLGGMFIQMQNYQRIRQAEEAAKRSSKKAIELAEQLRDLRDKVEKLVLVNMAMWSLLEEKSGLTQEQLMERVRRIDLSDGQLDGKVRPPKTVQRCPNCGRTMSTRHGRCLYCGAENLSAEPFDGVI